MTSSYLQSVAVPRRGGGAGSRSRMRARSGSGLSSSLNKQPAGPSAARGAMFIEVTERDSSAFCGWTQGQSTWEVSHVGSVGA